MVIISFLFTGKLSRSNCRKAIRAASRVQLFPRRMRRRLHRTAWSGARRDQSTENANLTRPRLTLTCFWIQIPKGQFQIYVYTDFCSASPATIFCFTNCFLTRPFPFFLSEISLWKSSFRPRQLAFDCDLEVILLCLHGPSGWLFDHVVIWHFFFWTPSIFISLCGSYTKNSKEYGWRNDRDKNASKPSKKMLWKWQKKIKRGTYYIISQRQEEWKINQSINEAE